MTGLPAQAVDMVFSTREGYSPTAGSPAGSGNLVGQPASRTAWQGAAQTKIGQDTYGQTLRVVAEPSRPDGQAGQVVRTFSVPTAGSPIYSYTPGEKELGGKFVPGHSRLRFSYSLRFDDNNAGGGYGAAFRANFSAIPFGVRTLKENAKPITNFEVTRGGRFRIAMNGFYPGVGEDGYRHEILCYALDTAGKVFEAPPGKWFRVEGMLDYGKKTLTVSVNGVPQSVDGNPNIPFATKDQDAPAPYFGMVVLANGTPGFRTLSVAGVSLALAPGA